MRVHLMNHASTRLEYQWRQASPDKSHFRGARLTGPSENPDQRLYIFPPQLILRKPHNLMAARRRKGNGRRHRARQGEDSVARTLPITRLVDCQGATRLLTYSFA